MFRHQVTEAGSGSSLSRENKTFPQPWSCARAPARARSLITRPCYRPACPISVKVLTIDGYSSELHKRKKGII